MLALFFTLQRLAADNGRAPNHSARHGEAVAKKGCRHAPVLWVLGPETLGLRTHRRRDRSRLLLRSEIE